MRTCAVLDHWLNPDIVILHTFSPGVSKRNNLPRSCRLFCCQAGTNSFQGFFCRDDVRGRLALEALYEVTQFIAQGSGPLSVQRGPVGGIR